MRGFRLVVTPLPMQITLACVFAVTCGLVAIAQQVAATRDAFYVGGEYVGPPDAPVMAGQMFQAAGEALLGRIGPAIVVTHSQSGALGWLLGDARPALVKAIVALEPSGPPFRHAV